MLYQVTATNKDGVDGTVQLSSGKSFATAHPLTDTEGLNPEELVSLAWSTCLNATIKALLEQKKLGDLDSRVEVTTELHKESTPTGYYFQVTAKCAIKDLEMNKVRTIIELAHERCPVSKLIGQAKTVEVNIVEWEQ